jgi:hypothetical protein
MRFIVFPFLLLSAWAVVAGTHLNPKMGARTKTDSLIFKPDTLWRFHKTENVPIRMISGRVRFIDSIRVLTTQFIPKEGNPAAGLQGGATLLIDGDTVTTLSRFYKIRGTKTHHVKILAVDPCPTCTAAFDNSISHIMFYHEGGMSKIGVVHSE